MNFMSKIKKCLINHETWIIYPEDKFKGLWDMVILT
jgi:hypothetical protein